MVLRHFKETTTQKIKIQHADRANTSLFLITSPRSLEVWEWQSRRCCEMSHSCPFNGLQGYFIFTPAKGAFSQHHRLISWLYPFDYIYHKTIVYVPLQLPRSSHQINSENASTVLTSLQASVQYSGDFGKGSLFLPIGLHLNWWLWDELSFPWAILYSLSFLTDTVLSTNLPGHLFIFTGN